MRRILQGFSGGSLMGFEGYYTVGLFNHEGSARLFTFQGVVYGFRR